MRSFLIKKRVVKGLKKKWKLPEPLFEDFVYEFKWKREFFDLEKKLLESKKEFDQTTVERSAFWRNNFKKRHLTNLWSDIILSLLSSKVVTTLASSTSNFCQMKQDLQHGDIYSHSKKQKLNSRITKYVLKTSRQISDQFIV